jgi:hypothetical protein
MIRDYIWFAILGGAAVLAQIILRMPPTTSLILTTISE